MGALIGITMGAAGVPQISLAIEAFADARSACYPAISVMARRKSEAGSTTKDDGATRLACSPLVTRLPKYEIDSSSTEGKSASSLKGEICFDDISFAYPSRSELILEGFSLSLKPGMVVGVVGPSGCGVSQFLLLYVFGAWEYSTLPILESLHRKALLFHCLSASMIQHQVQLLSMVLI